MKHFDLLRAQQRGSEGERAAPEHEEHGRPNRGAIVVIDRRDLARQCLSSWLAHEFSDRRVVALAGLSASESVPCEAPHVVIIALGAEPVGEPFVRQQLQACRQLWRRAPLVVVSERESSEEVMQALDLGVRGFIPAALAAGIVVEALRLVAAGGSFIPPSALNVAQPVRARPAGAEGSPRFTPRQREVLDRLSRGESNKAIAFELSMSENTVKVHIRHIMRKLGVSNRTQIALHGQAMAELGSGA